jgi:hypothetical protein
MLEDQEQDELTEAAAREAAEERLYARLRLVEDEARALRGKIRWLSLSLLAVVGVGGGAAFQSGLFSGKAGPVEATHFVLVDGAGRQRGEWLVDGDGNARFSVMDQQQRGRLLLTVRSAGDPGLALSNAAGQRRIALGLLPDETASLVFADGGGIPRAVLGLTGDESANLVFADGAGNSRIGLGLDRNGAGSVLLPDTDAGDGSE